MAIGYMDVVNQVCNTGGVQVTREIYVHFSGRYPFHVDRAKAAPTAAPGSQSNSMCPDQLGGQNYKG